MKNRLKIDIFCQIVDNFGDIGVTWRLAKQLSSAFGHAVRLWIDDIAQASHIIPALQTHAHQTAQPGQLLCQVDGVQLAYWSAAQDLDCQPYPVVIEAFACELPLKLQKNMSDHTRCWINLEYLSAQAWVPEYHLQSSLVSLNGLRKTFFFPGFGVGTGGLIREPNLFTIRDQWLHDHAHSLHLSVQSRHISLFAYAHAPINALLQALRDAPLPCHLYVPAGQCDQLLSEFFQTPVQAGCQYQCDQLTLHCLPWLSQQAYDQLLWRCDVNFVRGEDSLVRAIWAGKPLIWLPYQQDDGAEQDKLAAWLDAYWGEQLPTLRAINADWASGKLDPARFTALLGELAAITPLCQSRSMQQAQYEDLASQLNDYVSCALSASDPA